MSYTYKIKVTGIIHNTSWWYCSNQLSGYGKCSDGTIVKGTILQNINYGNSGNAGSLNNVAPGIIEFDKYVTSIEINKSSNGCNYMTAYNYYINDIYQTTINNTVYQSSKYIDVRNIREFYLIKKDNNYYSIKEDYYDSSLDQYALMLIPDIDIDNFDNYGINDLSLIHSNALLKLIDNKYNLSMLK